MFTARKTAAPLVLAAALLAACSAAFAVTRYEVANRLEDFRQYFVDFQYAPDKAIPGDLLADCHGVIIMRQYKAGFVFGVKGGDGVVLLHNRATGEWSPPAFLVSAEGSFGFQIGGQAIDGIILIMNQDGVNMLLNTRFKIGVDAAAAAGPVGRDLSAQVGPGTALLTYSRTKGLYAGASFEGGALLNNDKYNRALYGRDVRVRDIVIDRTVPMPPEASAIVNTLRSYAVRNTANPNPPPAPRHQPPPRPEPEPAPYSYGPAPSAPSARTPTYPPVVPPAPTSKYQQVPQYQDPYPAPPWYGAAGEQTLYPPASQDRDQASLEAAAREAARAAQEAQHAAYEAQRAAAEAAARAGW